MDVPSGWSRCAAQPSGTCTSGNRVRAPSGISCQFKPSAAAASGDSPQQSHVPRFSKSPDDVRKVGRLQAAIASLDEDQERSSLQQALKRAQQQTVLPLAINVTPSGSRVPKQTRRKRWRHSRQRLVNLPRSDKGRGCSLHISISTSNASGDRPANSSAGSSSRDWFAKRCPMLKTCPILRARPATMFCSCTEGEKQSQGRG